MKEAFDRVRALRFDGRGVSLLDQRLLPEEEAHVRCANASDVAAAIRDMVIRGAPAIGIAAAYGVVLAVRERSVQRGDWRARVAEDMDQLKAARPTAVNLAWAVDRMAGVVANAADPVTAAEREAELIHAEDVTANQQIGRIAADYLRQRIGLVRAVLTHCNTGSLATGGYGTALGVIRSLAARDGLDQVYVDETRPWLQGARLTAWELVHDGLPATVLADAAAPALLASGAVQAVVVGADRIAANGDVANKIGTYMLALAARHHEIPFLVAAPMSTIDRAVATGRDIPIETRDAEEVCTIRGRRAAAPGAEAWNPVFDITPAELVTAVVTEQGVIAPPDTGAIAALAG